MNDTLPFVELLPDERRCYDILLIRSEVCKESDTFKALLIFGVFFDDHLLDCMSKGNPIDDPESCIFQSNDFAVPFCMIKKS